MTALADNGVIGVYDLKNHLSAVLDEVVEGREVTVTKHGQPIARIAPIVQTTRERRRAASARIDELAREVGPLPPGMTIRELIDEGRKY